MMNLITFWYDTSYIQMPTKRPFGLTLGSQIVLDWFTVWKNPHFLFFKIPWFTTLLFTFCIDFANSCEVPKPEFTEIELFGDSIGAKFPSGLVMHDLGWKSVSLPLAAREPRPASDANNPTWTCRGTPTAAVETPGNSASSAATLPAPTPACSETERGRLVCWA